MFDTHIAKMGRYGLTRGDCEIWKILVLERCQSRLDKLEGDDGRNGGKSQGAELDDLWGGSIA